MTPRFRVSLITMDDEENVAAVTAVTAPRTLGVILARFPAASWDVLSEAERSVTLAVADMLALFRWCGSTPGTDPEYEHTHVIYDSLCRVVYGLMEDE